ncbi:MAG: hypothetical protein LKG20_08950 [Tetrasphaera jenkinsii]|nr:hypothetical protein [Tetrasphaera jenkinsii]
MREHEPRLHGDDFDQRFAEIVAGLADDPMFRDVDDNGAIAADADAPAIEPKDEPIAPATDVSAGNAQVAEDDAAADAAEPNPLGRHARPNDLPGTADLPPASAVNPPLFNSLPVWRGATGPTYEEILEQEDEEHFIPAPPAPLPPQEDFHFWGALVGLVGGPLLLLWLVLFTPDVARWWTWLALGLCVGGFVLLVLRGPKNHRDDENGAVV